MLLLVKIFKSLLNSTSLTAIALFATTTLMSVPVQAMEEEKGSPDAPEKPMLRSAARLPSVQIDDLPAAAAGPEPSAAVNSLMDVPTSAEDAQLISTGHFSSLKPKFYPFFWQIGMHYEKLLQTLADASEESLGQYMTQIAGAIEKNPAYFQDAQAAFVKELPAAISECLIDDEIMEGIWHQWQREKPDNVQDFQCWKADLCQLLYKLSPENCTRDKLTLDVLQASLSEGGGYFFETAVWNVYEKLSICIDDYADECGIPEPFLDMGFGNIWFKCDWKSSHIEAPDFLARAGWQTLKSIIDEKKAQEILGNRAKIAAQQVSLANSLSTLESLRHLKEEYDAHAKNHNWHEALITWSVYSAYRHMFDQKKNVKESDLRKKHEKARKHYTKVYPTTNTSKVIYGVRRQKWGDARPEKLHKVATLDIVPILSGLKFVGQEIEKLRPQNEEGKQVKNILVPVFYVVISDRPHVKDGDHKRIFVPVQLEMPFLEKRLLTQNPGDGVFQAIVENNQAGHQDYYNGQKIRGVPDEDAQELITHEADKKLRESERVWIELLRDERAIDAIVNSLKDKVREKCTDWDKGPIKVYSLLSLLYSTNSICSYCTSSLISAQNSYAPGGFLSVLTQKLNQGMPGDTVSFKTRGYTVDGQDPAKFRWHTIVTAAANFDPQSSDLAEGADLARGGPSGSHNPDAKLAFPEDAIDLHAEPLIDAKPLATADLMNTGPLRAHKTRDPVQRFFYEFVGKDLHKAAEASVLPFSGVAFSSGGDSWSHKVAPNILKPVAAAAP